MAKLILMILALALSVSAVAQLPKATVPTADRKGSKDSSLLKRYEGSYIVSQDGEEFRRVRTAAVKTRASARQEGGQ